MKKQKTLIFSLPERAFMTSEVYPLHTFHKWAYAIRRQKEEEGKNTREKSQEFSYFHEITSSINRKHPSRHWYGKLKNLVSIAYFDITLDSVSLKNKHYESLTSERQEIWQALTDVIKLCQFKTFKYQKSLEKLPIEASFDSACPLMFPSCHLRFFSTKLNR